MTDRLVLHTRVVTGSGGGPDKTILNSARFLQQAGYEFLCAYMRHPEDPLFPVIESRARHWNAPLVAIDDRGPFDYQVLRQLRELAGRIKPRIWHAHEYKSNILGLAIRGRQPMQLVTTVHGWVKRTWKTPLYYALDRLSLRRYDGVICVSEDLHQRCLDLGIPPERCWHVPNAIDTSEYRRLDSIAAAKERYGVDSQRVIVGAIGRLSKEKGFHILIQALKSIAADLPDVELWIIGEGSEIEPLRRLAAELNLADRVKIRGYEPEIAELLQAMDVFVLSSSREGLPNVLLEAMALELPVLASKVAGVPRLIDDRQNGLLMEPNSASDLAEGLALLISDSKLRESIGKAARRTVVESYGFERRMEAILSIYDQVLAGEEESA